MASCLNLILLLISVFYLFFLLIRFRRNSSIYYVLMAICIVLINYGYWQIGISEIVEEALVAGRLHYLGVGFVSYFMVCTIAQICKTRIPLPVRCVGIGISTVVTVLATTMGYSTIYYKSVRLVQENGYAYLEKEYGWAHMLLIVQILLFLVYGLSIAFRAFLRKKQVSYVSVIGSLAVMASMSGLYFVKVGNYSLLPFAYDLGYAILLLLLTRIRLHDTVAISQESMENDQQYGFVNFDFKGRFLDGDDKAREWFPELNELKIDYVIPAFSTDFLKQVSEWMTGADDSATRWFERGERIIAATRVDLRGRGSRRVLCINLRDDTKQQKYTRLIEQYNRDLQRNILQKTKRMAQMQNDVIVGMVSAVEHRDSNTGGHVLRSSEVVRVFVQHLLETGGISRLDEQMAECIVRSAPLHDFGKIEISDRNLNKPGRYTPEEYEEMKRHPALGAEIVAKIFRNSDNEMLKNIAMNVAHYHHEKWDGTGYPDHLAGENIPLEARIMALADVFDALVSKRTYKEAFPFDRSFEIIREQSGSQFDPVLCRRFLECKDRLIAVYKTEEAKHA